jgi:hypothetical protein
MSLYLDSKSLDWALEHALKLGDTDIFPPAFEFQALAHTWPDVRQELVKEDVLSWKTREHRYCLVPKGRHGFRVATQLDPLDFLIYAALVYEIGEDLEQHRLPVREGIVYSYRFAPESNGRIFDLNFGYKSFLARCKEVTEGVDGYVAVTDISDFYSRLYHHPLNNTLSVATRFNNHVGAIMHLLNGWYQHVSYGIPIGNAPSRLLAETAISGIDSALLAADIRFVRFNDDYRLLARSRAEAYKHVSFLAELLYDSHGLTLQPQKTDILPVDEFRSRYLLTPREREAAALRAQFHEFVDALGLDDPYQPISLADLEEDQTAMLEAMNLGACFRRK